MEMFSKETYIARRAKLKAAMGKGIGVFYGNSEVSINYADNTYPFRQDSTFLYFFGIIKPNLVGVIDFESGEEWLYGDDADIDDVVWTGPLPTIADFAAMCGVAKSAPMSAFHDAIAAAKKQGRKVHFLPPYKADVTLALSSLLGISLADLRQNCGKRRGAAVFQRNAIDNAVNVALGGSRLHKAHCGGVHLITDGARTLNLGNLLIRFHGP